MLLAKDLKNINKNVLNIYEEKKEFPCITILNPYATFILLGKKHYETRSWKYKDYTGDILIHSAQKVDKQLNEKFNTLIDEHKLKGQMKYSSILCAVKIDSYLKVIENNEIDKYAILENGDKIDGIEYLLGNYNIGNYAWKISNIRPATIDIYRKGQQRVWYY